MGSPGSELRFLRGLRRHDVAKRRSQIAQEARHELDRVLEYDPGREEQGHGSLEASVGRVH